MVNLPDMVREFGYPAIGLGVLVVSAGFPIPVGELLVAAAIYASQTHKLDIGVLVLVAAAGATAGGVVGFGIGQWGGARLLERYGRFVGFGAARVRLGQFLFRRHGGKIVFFIRFMPLLAPFGGVLAGMNRMPWRRFLVFDALGGVAWAAVMALGPYIFGEAFTAVGRPVGVAGIVALLVLAVVGARRMKRYEARLQAEADADAQRMEGPVGSAPVQTS